MALILRPPGFGSGLADHLANLGSTRRRAALASGLLRFVTAAVGLTSLVAILDAAVHLQPLVRGAGLLAALVAAGVQWYLGVAVALRMPTDPLGVALTVEQAHPSLNDSLGSAVSFLLTADEGSRCPGAQLRSAAIRMAEKQADRHDLTRLIPSARLWRSIWCAAAVVAITVPLAAWDSKRAAVALLRFADPFGAHPWPPKTRIDIQSPANFPHRMPKGESFEVRFAVRGEIPSQAELTVLLEGGTEFSESYPLVDADGRTPQPAPTSPPLATGSTRSRREREAYASVRIPAEHIPRSFQFRIRANDGDSGWRAVTVANPPRLVALDGRPSPQLHVSPPEYTGLQPFERLDGPNAISIPFASRLRLRAATDLRLSSATIAYQGPVPGFGMELAEEAGDAPRPSHEHAVPDLPVAISSDDRTLEADFVPAHSGLYSLRMTDESGISGTWSLRINVERDPMPQVTLRRPALGKDPPVLVPTASVTVHVEVADRKYAYRRVGLEYRVGKGTAVRSIPFADVQRAGAVLPAIAGPAGAVRPQPTAFDETTTIPVAQFVRDDSTPVREGDIIILWAVADDWDDATPGKLPGRSEPVQISIVSKAAAEAYVLEQLVPLQKEVALARTQQQNARGQLIEISPEPDGALTPLDREKLLSVEPVQQQVRARVAALRTQAERLRETVRINGLEGTPTGDRVQAVAEGLDRLAERDLTAIGPIFADVRRLAIKAPPRDEAGRAVEVFGLPLQVRDHLLRVRGSEVRKSLGRVERSQGEIEDGLTALLDVLSIWGGAGEIRGEAISLRIAVLREAAIADRLPARVPPGRPPSALNPEQRDELDRTVARLDSLVERANRLIARTQRLVGEKELAAAETQKRAEALDVEAEKLRTLAATAPPDSPEREPLLHRAERMAVEAADRRAESARNGAEAAALRRALIDADDAPADVDAREKVLAAIGGGPSVLPQATGTGRGQRLVDELREARRALESNRPGQAAPLERSAASRLDRMATALAERKPESDPDQVSRWKATADQLDALAADQFDLDRRIAGANQLPEPVRTETLKALAAEQQKLIDRGKELVQRLTRDRADAPAKDVREALDRMQTARNDLERGKPPGTAPRDAVEKLDDARDRLDQARANAPRAEVSERKRRIIERLALLRDEQRRLTVEADRLQKRAADSKGWDRDVLSDYSDLKDRERVLAEELRLLAVELQDYPVFAQLLDDAVGGMEVGAVRIEGRIRSIVEADPNAEFSALLEARADARVRRPMELASRRLDMVLTALTQAPDLPADVAGVVVPIAQAQPLRTLQAELNDRTAAFDKTHPDRSKLDEFAREELREIEDVQRELAALFSLKSVAELFITKPPSPEGVKP